MANITIDQVRSVDWASKFDWEVRFPDAPAPFHEWFPAFDVEEEIAILNEYSFDVANTTIHIPQNTRAKELKVSFNDSSDFKILSWFQEWIEAGILNRGKGTSSVMQACKTILIYKKDRTGKVVKESGYRVYPMGQISFSGSNDNGAQSFSVAFRVVARIINK